jgi:uracil-DNA glycosylase
MSEGTINRLSEFYSREGISALHFKCPCRVRCEAAAKRDGGTFTTAREPVVGLRYLDSRPRIVVVSLDPGSQFDKNKGRFFAPEEMQLQVRKKIASNEELGPRNRHWYRTHVGVAKIVEAVTQKTITVNDAALWFAHTSVVRCCANLPQSRQAPWEMFWGCRDYLEEEIRILAPDIIWTQGGQAYDAMSWLARHIDPLDASLKSQRVRQVGFQGGLVEWVHTNHPSKGWSDSLNIIQSVSWRP